MKRSNDTIGNRTRDLPGCSRHLLLKLPVYYLILLVYYLILAVNYLILPVYYLILPVYYLILPYITLYYLYITLYYMYITLYYRYLVHNSILSCYIQGYLLYYCKTFYTLGALEELCKVVIKLHNICQPVRPSTCRNSNPTEMISMKL